jgi:hypothetical protein
MKKIVPFKKEVEFPTSAQEITSISLEHTLQVGDENIISGNFIISGEYKMTDASIMAEKFEFNLPFSINVDAKYNIENARVDIDDFYYELVNQNGLDINIDVVIDDLEVRSITEELDIEPIAETEEEPARCVEDEEPLDRPKTIDKINSLFDNLDNSSETYQTYHVYIVRDGDSLENIMNKYNVSRDELDSYNDLNDLKIGDKIIIPSCINEKV